jgi:hypothetical protein
MLDILKNTFDIGEKLARIIGSLKVQITGDEKAAAKDLQLVVDEMVKFYQVAQQELLNVQCLDFADNMGINSSKKILFDIQSGAMQVRISEASGSCSKIKRIYNSYLDTWFQKKFRKGSQEYIEVQGAFVQLSEYDLSMVEAMKDIDQYLIPRAEHMLGLIKQNNQHELIRYHTTIVDEMTDIRLKLSQITKQLIDLSNEFSGSTKFIN